MASSRRTSLPQVPASAVEHAGLWLERFLPAQPERDKPVERSPQADHIADAARIREPVLYRPAFARWERALAAAGATVRTGVVEGRVVVGLGAESVLETAITLHRAYGVPYIPGTALKGMAAAYARRFLEGPWARGGEAYRVLFGEGGHAGQAGYVTFYDALYIPGSGSGGRPLDPDVLTVHHADYYMRGAKPPADWDSPNPVAFMSATGHYLLALSGPNDAWVGRAFELLTAALAEVGVGAKTASGYGRMAVRPYSGLGAPAQSRGAAPPPAPTATPNVAGTSAPVAPEVPPPSEVAIPDVGAVVRGRVVRMDASAAVIELDDIAQARAVAVMAAEVADLRRYRVGNRAWVEVVERREQKSGRMLLTVRPAPRREG